MTRSNSISKLSGVQYVLWHMHWNLQTELLLLLCFMYHIIHQHWPCRSRDSIIPGQQITFCLPGTSIDNTDSLNFCNYPILYLFLVCFEKFKCHSPCITHGSHLICNLHVQYYRENSISVKITKCPKEMKNYNLKSSFVFIWTTRRLKSLHLTSYRMHPLHGKQKWSLPSLKDQDINIWPIFLLMVA